MGTPSFGALSAITHFSRVLRSHLDLTFFVNSFFFLAMVLSSLVVLLSPTGNSFSLIALDTRFIVLVDG